MIYDEDDDERSLKKTKVYNFTFRMNSQSVSYSFWNFVATCKVAKISIYRNNYLARLTYLYYFDWVALLIYLMRDIVERERCSYIQKLTVCYSYLLYYDMCLQIKSYKTQRIFVTGKKNI